MDPTSTCLSHEGQYLYQHLNLKEEYYHHRRHRWNFRDLCGGRFR